MYQTVDGCGHLSHESHYSRHGNVPQLRIVSYLLLVCPLRSKENLQRRAEYAKQRLRAKNAPLIYLTLLHISYDERRAHPGSPLAAHLPGLVEFRQPPLTEITHQRGPTLCDRARNEICYRELICLTDHTIKHGKTRKPGSTRVSDPDQKKDHSHRAKGQALKF